MQIGISADTTSVVTHLGELSPAVRKALVGSMESIIARLKAEVESNIMGSTTTRTGKLLGSVRGGAREYERRVVGWVWSEGGAEAGALEWGAHRATEVKAHTRQRNVVFGRLVAPFEVAIRAYSRTPNIAERRFMRNAVNANRADITAELQTAASGAVAD